MLGAPADARAPPRGHEVLRPQLGGRDALAAPRGQREGARRAFDGTGQDVETGTRGETGTRVPRTHLKHAGSLSQKHWEVVG